jgi:hypothetical protein
MSFWCNVIPLTAMFRFTSRISVTSLFHIAYKRLPPNVQKDFRTMYIKLCSDDTPMVRLCTHGHGIYPPPVHRLSFFDCHTHPTIQPLDNPFYSEANDIFGCNAMLFFQVRRMSAQHFGEFCGLLSPSELEEFLPPFKKIAVDDQVSMCHFSCPLPTYCFPLSAC